MGPRPWWATCTANRQTEGGFASSRESRLGSPERGGGSGGPDSPNNARRAHAGQQARPGTRIPAPRQRAARGPGLGEPRSCVHSRCAAPGRSGQSGTCHSRGSGPAAQRQKAAPGQAVNAMDSRGPRRAGWQGQAGAGGRAGRCAGGRAGRQAAKAPHLQIERQQRCVPVVCDENKVVLACRAGQPASGSGTPALFGTIGARGVQILPRCPTPAL